MPVPAILGLIPLLAPLIPEITRWIAGSDAEKAAQGVVDVVQTVVGSTDPAMVAAALADDGKRTELLLELRRLEHELDRIREEHATQRLQDALKDKQDARATMQGLVQAGSRLAIMPAFMTGALTLGFFGVLVALLFRTSDFAPSVREVLLVVVGILVGEFKGACSYWLGSSAGSADKAKTLDGLLRPFQSRGRDQ